MSKSEGNPKPEPRTQGSDHPDHESNSLHLSNSTEGRPHAFGFGFRISGFLLTSDLGFRISLFSFGHARPPIPWAIEPISGARSVLGFRNSGFLRISAFGFRISPEPLSLAILHFFRRSDLCIRPSDFLRASSFG